MQENLTRKPFILALHDDHAPTLRELREEEAQRVGGGGDFCDGPFCAGPTIIYTPDVCEAMECWCDDV
jgi:hypothetical protein